MTALERIIQSYARLITESRISIDDVPERWRIEVEILLSE